MRFCAIALLILTACSAPQETPDGTDPAPPTPPNHEVIVLGMIHGEHRTSEHYSLEVVQELIRAIDPDYVLAEIPPDRLATAQEEFAAEGTIQEPRVSRFPEYVDALFPLTREMDFEIIPTAAWTHEMADSRRATMEAIRNDLTRSEDWSAYTTANAAADAAIAAGGAPDDPCWIHTDGYDAATEVFLSVYNDLFNDEIGAGGWDNINAAHYALITEALDQHPGEGKRFLITFGAGHKGWFLRHLRQRDDIELLEVEPFLDAGKICS